MDRWGLEPAPLDQVQRSYARADHRPLEHAVRLLLSLLPRTLAPVTEDANTQRRVAANLDMARNCLGHTLPKASGARSDNAEPRVRAIDAVRWAESIRGTVPSVFAEALRQHAERRGLSDLAGQPKTRKLLPQQIHRHRCAGIAVLLWQKIQACPLPVWPC